MTRPAQPARFALVSPSLAGGPGGLGGSALAMIALHGDIDDALGRARIAPVGIGRVNLRDLAGVDRGVVARWTADSATLIPHGGGAVVRALLGALQESGLIPTPRLAPQEAYPEARSLLEARMLDALAHAASPRAVDLLLTQPARWAEFERQGEAFTPEDEARSARLARLLVPPLVVALGAPNIGKSTLLNTLAGREVALVADRPGTTRDHVGALLDLAGVVVRFVDAPGIDSLRPTQATHGPDAEAQTIALDLARGADLILRCCDSGPGAAQALDLPALLRTLSPPPSLTLALRADRGEPANPADHAVSIPPPVEGGPRPGDCPGIKDLVAGIAERLVPRADRESTRPWRFWAADGP